MNNGYMYVIKQGNDYFALFGDFKKQHIYPKYAFEISNKKIGNGWKATPFGYVSNVSCDNIINDFEVVYQYDYDFIQNYKRTVNHIPKTTGIDWHRMYECGLLTKQEFMLKVLF